MKTKVFIVDDEKSLRLSLREILESANFEVFEESSGGGALRRIPSVAPQVVLLDIGLGDLDGLTVLRKLREWAKFPILVVSVQNSESLIVRALDLGADDYLSKPFSGPELLARIRSALRRAQRDPGRPKLRFADIEVDLLSAEVRVGGQEVKLSSTEWEVLRTLVQEPGRVITLDKILRQVWGAAGAENVANLRVYVGHLRSKLGAHGADAILNEPGIGYRALFEPV
ncbi:MAG TPA: response regulator transcription factor [Bdellovibrionota bacterium]|nr:response regulator transcription factor [Bdellovibrionota bacterium]